MVMVWLALAGGLVGLVTIFVENQRWGIIILCAGIGALVGESLQTYIFLPRKVKKLYAQYKGIALPITLQWDAMRLIGQSETGRGERQWKDYAKVKENDLVFLLYITDYLFEVIPKGWFSEPQMLQEFTTYARAGRES